MFEGDTHGSNLQNENEMVGVAIMHDQELISSKKFRMSRYKYI